MKCNCRSCCESRLIDSAIRNRQFDVLVRFVRRLQNDSRCMGEDRAYLQAILDGTWPSAEEQLLAALEKVKQRELLSRSDGH